MGGGLHAGSYIYESRALPGLLPLDSVGLSGRTGLWFGESRAPHWSLEDVWNLRSS